MPVVPNFLITHQWVRELKRRGFRTAVGVYFKIPDETPVFAGPYNADKQSMSASAAAAYLRQSNMLGFEVTIPRSIKPSEIMRVAQISQGLGWRYTPDSHRTGIFCGCEYCMKGQIRSRDIRRRWEAKGAR